MLKEQSSEGMVELLREVEEVRTQVRKSEKTGLRAREDIYGLLDQAFQDIENGGSQRSRNQAACKIDLARQRFAQAEGQKRWVAVIIGVWMAIFTSLGALAIYQGQFWPKAIETTAQEVLFGAVVWGVVGAAIDGFRELHTRLARQELDVNRVAWYLAHPLLGAGLGGIIFLLVSGGLLVTGQDVVDFNPSLPLILAALTGFEQQNVIRYLRDTIRQILRIQERSPEEGG